MYNDTTHNAPLPMPNAVKDRLCNTLLAASVVYSNPPPNPLSTLRFPLALPAFF